MITQWVFDVFCAFCGWVIGLIQLPETPDFLTGFPDKINLVIGYVAGTAAWFPWPVVAAVIATWVISVGAAFVIKAVRIVASFMTLGGGSAA